MKITLNTSIPENRRAQVEALVRKHARATEIVWRPSRFPRFVMLVEPELDGRLEPQNDSIFDSPDSETESLSSMTEGLEQRIKACLSESPPA